MNEVYLKFKKTQIKYCHDEHCFSHAHSIYFIYLDVMKVVYKVRIDDKCFYAPAVAEGH